MVTEAGGATGRRRHMEQAVAIVTGAASGIGRGIADYLAERGVAVVLADIQDGEGKAAEQQLAARGAHALYVHADVTKKAEVEALAAAATERFGRLDYLVNNAGVVTMTPFLELPEEEWDRVVNIDLKGQFLCAQAFAREVIRQQHGGAIVNLGTVESEVVSASGEHCQVHYNAAKGGVKMLTKGIAFELAPYNIRVNGINPGTIQTGFAGDIAGSPQAMEHLMKRALIKRVGQPVDIARVAWFLLSDDAGYMTGTMVNVDGGWLVQ
jgi:NAD(P)-dependent dehydrogenase (short-subunit alcohol dehydrogenase family)